MEATRRFVVSGLLATAGMSVLPAGPALALSTATVAAKLQTFEVESSELDTRSFRGLRLPNGLRVLLCSDPAAKKAAAAMDVQVGWMSDPKELPGLAHFCEHMLFLGTSGFPEEGDFERYVAAAGGSNNAYTDSEETCYYFDVSAGALPGALERFSEFFSAPLFTESATAREVSAINSEHAKNLQQDYWRYEQLLKLRANQEHPYANFGTGNAATLSGGDAAARRALLTFHRAHYVASQMSLAIVGPQSLAELQRLATAQFGKLPATEVPPASAAYDALPLPFPPGQGGSLTLMKPVAEQRSLTVAWCVPVLDFEQWASTKPDVVWRLLLNTRVDGGLVKALRAEGLISGLDASVEELTRTFALLSVSFDLTALGLERWPEVASALYAYLQLLRDGGVPRHVFSEARQINALAFRYAEPPEPQAFATSAAGTLPFYAPSKWLTGPALLSDGAATEPLVKALLEATASPDDALMTLAAPKLPGKTPLTEPIYGTKHGKLDVSAQAAAWRRAQPLAGLTLPTPNRFLPTTLAIKTPPRGGARGATLLEIARQEAFVAAPGQPRGGGGGGGGGAQRVQPRLVLEAPGVRLHHLQDTTFQLPRGFAFFELRTPLVMSSPEAAVLSELYTGLLADSLLDDTAEAAAAGLLAGVSVDSKGFTLSASGYDERLPQLAATVASQLKTAPLKTLDFERRRASLLDSLANLERRQPVALASYHRGLALETPRYGVEPLRAAAAAASLEKLADFQANMLAEVELEGLVCGNLMESEAREMLATLQRAVPASPLPPAASPRRRVVQLPVGARTRQHVASNPQEENCAVDVYFQVGRDDGGMTWRLLGLFSQLVDTPFYAELRTRQQLGYIVGSSIAESEGVRGLVFSVQSSALTPPELEARVDGFLRGYRATLAAMPEAELSAYREALAVQVSDVDKRLAQQAGRFWGEVVMRRYDYDRPWRLAAQVRTITRAQLLTFFDTYLAPEGAQRRRLATHVYSRKAAPRGQLQLDALSEVAGAEPLYYPPPTPGRIPV